jgi:hypothetical protein
LVDDSRADNEIPLKPPIYVVTGDEDAITLGVRPALQTAGTEEKRADGHFLSPSFLKTLAMLHDF